MVENTNGNVDATYDAIVVGAGIGGLYAVYKLREMGLSVLGIEAGDNVGGVWYWNRYPGARCDLLTIDYCYTFSPEVDAEWSWSEQFAAQPEILEYINFVADRHELRKDYLFETRVERAAYDEARQLWSFRTSTGKTFEATYAVMATGPLSVPKKPDFEDFESFKGELYYSGRWPKEPVSYEGKRVGVVGVGSTGIQIIPVVAQEAQELTVFQRTPSFTMPMRNHKHSAEYTAEIKRNLAAMRAGARNSPLGGVRPATTRPYFSLPPEQRVAIMESAWQNGGHTFLGSFADLMQNEEANEQVAEFVRGKISEVVKDPETAETLKPRGYPIFARRACLDTNYYETYNEPHVSLVDCFKEPIVGLTEKGVRTATREIELDMLILATGYDGLTGALMAFDVVGRGGKTINQEWKDGAHSYLGLMMKDFPNLFMICGPNGPSALANIFTINEQNVNWLAQAIDHMRGSGLTAMEPTGEAEQEWMDLVHDLSLNTLVSKAKTWYTGANVAGKARGLTMYTGGFKAYREACQDAADDNWRGLVFEKAGVREAVD
ncbi:flavin-containing monooxygenase [Novosphingobium clariflavum]|uniref:Flavin-containing monooxygenase n=1 Tax=Novosphingobium clariflavum TaxID=2029884 RepID=A0ABV6S4P4_9SPHN|nr:NAD(P)/FAD-dependent oxidoreductase [Novosphingobium clariflavum]